MMVRWATRRRYVIVTARPERPRYMALLDGQLGTSHAERFLAPGGLWHHWAASLSYRPDVDVYRDRIARLCAV